MSVRRAIMKAMSDAAEDATAAVGRRKPKNRKMPKQGAKYDVQDIFPTGLMGFQDAAGHSYTRYTLGGQSYMRRKDGVWYKRMREGTWSSMLGSPKGGEALHMQWQGAKGAGAAAAVGVAGDQIRRKAFGGN